MSFRVLLFIVSLSTLVLGDANHKYKVTKLEVENKKNDYFGEWTGKFENGKGSAKINVGFSVEKEIPEDGMMINMKIEMPGQEPIDKSLAFAEALEDKTIGESFVQTVTPKDTLSKKWPLPKGSYSAKNWVPSMDSVPSGTEGPVTITATIGLDGQEPCAKIVAELELMY